MRSYIPSDRLKPFIKTYLVIESAEDIINRIVPDTGITVVFRFKGQVNIINAGLKEALPPITVSGLRRSSRLINYEKNSGNIVVRFKETGATAFLKKPLHELFESSISIDHFFPRHEVSETEELLAGACDDHQRISIIDAFLLSKIADANSDNLITAALQKIHLQNGVLKIRDLEKTLYISQDAFEKRFRSVVGTSPKQFASIVRMQTILKQKQVDQSFTQIAFNSAYFDQAHFIKDFKRFTGLTPTEFYKKPSYW